MKFVICIKDAQHDVSVVSDDQHRMPSSEQIDRSHLMVFSL